MGKSVSTWRSQVDGTGGTSVAWRSSDYDSLSRNELRSVWGAGIVVRLVSINDVKESKLELSKHWHRDWHSHSHSHSRTRTGVASQNPEVRRGRGHERETEDGRRETRDGQKEDRPTS